MIANFALQSIKYYQKIRRVYERINVVFKLLFIMYIIIFHLDDQGTVPYECKLYFSHG